MTAMTAPTVRLCHLYPDLMNIYADRGNIAVIQQRLAWRGMDLLVTPVSIGDPLDAGPAADRFDLYYLGGGQDRDQDLVAADLAAKGPVISAAADRGAAQLYVCGGIQLAGHHYVTADGERLPGVGVLDLTTEAGQSRLIGDLVIDVTLDGETRRVVGYENHVGRTVLGSAARPLGSVVSGHGNNGTDGGEGAVRDRVIGTYLHGPLLPKNPWLADIVLGWALAHRYGSAAPTLEPIDDGIESRAHRAAIERAMSRN